MKGEIFNDYANNTAGGGYTHAEGYMTHADSWGAHAEGGQTNALGNYSHAEGLNTGAAGEASHAEGYKTSTGVKGYSNLYAVGTNSLIIESTEPAKYYSIGDNLQIGLVDGSILKDKFKINNIYEINWGGAVPDATQIELSKLTDEDITISISDIKYIGVYNKPYGDIVIAEGAHAHAEGYNTLAIGENAHAEGKDTVASGDYSHAGGIGTIASAEAQTAVGQYNAEDSNAIFIVGNGKNESERHNAFTINKEDGSANFFGYIKLQRGVHYGTESEIPADFPEGGLWFKVVE